MKFVGELSKEQLDYVDSCNLRLNDAARLLALKNTGLMDTPREEAFDRLCRLAAKILNVPLSIVSLVNNKKQFFKADFGLPAPFNETRELPIDFSLCRYTMAGHSIISSDASADPFLRCHPSTVPWGISSLIVLPLITEDGHVLGTFCVIQPTPREWTDLDLEIMKELTASIMTEINLRNKITRLKLEQNFRDTFVAAMTHDLRTPITVAKLTAQMLARRHPDDEEINTSAAKINSSLDRSDKMIQNLLDVNKLNSGSKLELKIEDCCLNVEIEQVLQELSVIYGPRFRFISKEEINCKVDPIAMRRIAENLISNAAKYSSPDTPVEVLVIRDLNAIKISVKNFGNPISEADQIHIFEPFHRTIEARNSGQTGWGLGLQLVRGLVEAHGGSVDVRSNEQEGTCFTVEVPANRT